MKKIFLIAFCSLFLSGCGYKFKIVDVEDEYVRLYARQNLKIMILLNTVDSLQTELYNCQNGTGDSEDSEYKMSKKDSLDLILGERDLSNMRKGVK